MKKLHKSVSNALVMLYITIKINLLADNTIKQTIYAHKFTINKSSAQFIALRSLVAMATSHSLAMAEMLFLLRRL